MAVSVSAGACVHAYLARQVDSLRHYTLPALRAEDDAVHQMRVATRRLRSLLTSYGFLYAAMPLSRKRLRWIAGVLGEVRDLEVLRTRFASRLGDERPQWFEALCAAEHAAYERLASAFARERFSRLRASAEDLVEHPRFSLAAVRPASDVLAPVVRAAKRRMDEELATVTSSGDPNAARHRARKAAKQARYTAEAAFALGREAETVAAEAKLLQTAGGHYQDCVVAIAYLTERADPDDPVLAAEKEALADLEWP